MQSFSRSLVNGFRLIGYWFFHLIYEFRQFVKRGSEFTVEMADYITGRYGNEQTVCSLISYRTLSSLSKNPAVLTNDDQNMTRIPAS